MAGEWIVKECVSEDAHPYDSYGSGYNGYRVWAPGYWDTIWTNRGWERVWIPEHWEYRR